MSLALINRCDYTRIWKLLEYVFDQIPRNLGERSFLVTFYRDHAASNRIHYKQRRKFLGWQDAIEHLTDREVDEIISALKDRGYSISIDEREGVNDILVRRFKISW